MVLVATDSNAADIVAYCLSNGATVLGAIILRPLNVHVGSNGFETYKVLIETKAVDINQYIPWFGDVLGIMTDANNIDWVKYCLEHGADPNKNLIEEFRNPLAAAASNGNTDMVQLLLDYGAALNGSGAIVVAAAAGYGHIVLLLLENGADIGHEGLAVWLIDARAGMEIGDAQGRTPEVLALQYNRRRVLGHIRRGIT
jgi:hypothetical protein